MTKHDDKNNKAKKDILKLTSSIIQKRNLILASLITTAYEIMKNSLIDQPRDFFTFQIDENNPPQISEEFEEELRNIRKDLPKKEQGNLLLVMAMWFRNRQVLIDRDVDLVKRIRSYRNEVVHELLKFVIDSDFEVNINYLFEIKEIIEKVDVWWIKEFVVPTNPSFDGIEVRDLDIQSGKKLVMDLLISIAIEINGIVIEDKRSLVH